MSPRSPFAATFAVSLVHIASMAAVSLMTGATGGDWWRQCQLLEVDVLGAGVEIVATLVQGECGGLPTRLNWAGGSRTHLQAWTPLRASDVVFGSTAWVETKGVLES